MLLDAGAGDDWRWVEPGSNLKYERSEGIALASLYMFTSSAFTASKSTGVPLVDGKYIRKSSCYRRLANVFDLRQGSIKLVYGRSHVRISGFR